MLQGSAETKQESEARSVGSTVGQSVLHQRERRAAYSTSETARRGA